MADRWATNRTWNVAPTGVYSYRSSKYRGRAIEKSLPVHEKQDSGMMNPVSARLTTVRQLPSPETIVIDLEY
jgi:hypothetical protein